MSESDVKVIYDMSESDVKIRYDRCMTCQGKIWQVYDMSESDVKVIYMLWNDRDIVFCHGTVTKKWLG